MTPRDDPSWEQYTNTVLEFPGVGLRVDLRRALSVREAAEVREAGERLGLGPAFCVITPFNPRGRTVGAAENGARLWALERALSETGLAHAACDGSDPERTHVERGFAVGATRRVGVGIARQWEQSALFEFDGERFWLVPALTLAEARALP